MQKVWLNVGGLVRHAKQGTLTMPHTDHTPTLSARLKFFTAIKAAVREISNLDYSVITGGFIHTAARQNDVDIVSVISAVSGDSREIVLRLAQEHVRAQKENGFVPDMSFPTDVVTRQQIVDAVNGRSLHVSDGKLALKHYTEEEIVTNPEADYRIWLFEMISHDFDLIDGSFRLLVQDTTRALRTIFLLAYDTLAYHRSVHVQAIRAELFTLAGLPYKLKERQCRHLLSMLELEDFGHFAGGTLRLNDEHIVQEIANLKHLLEMGAFRSGEHIVPWCDLRKHILDDTKNTEGKEQQ